jgi:glycosyltransferase involved in cell wall biosynthesis
LLNRLNKLAKAQTAQIKSSGPWIEGNSEGSRIFQGMKNLSVIISSPTNFSFHRKGRSIQTEGKIHVTQGKSLPTAVYLSVGNRDLRCKLTDVDPTSGQLHFSTGYRSGVGLKRLVFSAEEGGGKRVTIAVRYLFIGKEDIGPPVSIPKRSNALPNGINLIGPLQYALGLGEAGRGLLEVLRQFDLPHCAVASPIVLNCEKCLDFDSRRFERRLPHYINLFHLNAPEMSNVRQQWPRVLSNGQYNVGFWYFELPQLPSDWMTGFEGLSEVWVATQFVYHSVKRDSPVPVHVVPPVVSVQTPLSFTKAEFDLPEDKFCLLSVFDFNSYHQRKNPEAGLAAFNIASLQNPNLHFVLKMINSDQHSDSFYSLRTGFSDRPNVTLITAMLPRAALTRLQSACDAFISLHHSEGFGLNLTECMALGKPVIATNWSGNTDYMNSDNSCPVDYKLVTLAETTGPYEEGQVWAEPSIEHAAEYILKLASDREFVSTIGENAKHTIETFYAPAVVGKGVRKRYDAIVSSRSNRRRFYRRGSTD